jgi:hypothetical protein
MPVPSRKAARRILIYGIPVAFKSGTRPSCFVKSPGFMQIRRGPGAAKRRFSDLVHA